LTTYQLFLFATEGAIKNMLDKLVS